MSGLVDAAVESARRGWRVLPVDGKRPRLAGGMNAATDDAETIRDWWKRWPDAGGVDARNEHVDATFERMCEKLLGHVGGANDVSGPRTLLVRGRAAITTLPFPLPFPSAVGGCPK